MVSLYRLTSYGSTERTFNVENLLTRTRLQAKLPRVRVTQANLPSESSCGIDELLLEASQIREFKYFEICNINNGERFRTCVIRAARESGESCSRRSAHHHGLRRLHGCGIEKLAFDVAGQRAQLAQGMMPRAATALPLGRRGRLRPRLPHACTPLRARAESLEGVLAEQRAPCAVRK
jgi:hypothetical protein